MADVLSFDDKRARLAASLRQLGRVAIAVSGGVDSMALAAFAHSLGDVDATMFHASSPAVPGDALARVEETARARRWSLVVVNAGELDDARYVSNPINRCYFCKSDLYDTIARATDAPICAGTNLDDLDDFRPGLQAARERDVRHPFVDAAMTKDDVRALARWLDLPALAALPSSPCLSSRIETGIAIAPAVLRVVDAVESAARRRGLGDVRCRVRSSGVVLEHAGTIDADVRAALADEVAPILQSAALPGALAFAPYRRGSAFLHVVPG